MKQMFCKYLKPSALCGLVVAGFIFAGNPAVAEDALSNTRWHIASYLYLLNYGHYDQATTETNLDLAAHLGFNAVRFNVWWHEIYPDEAAAKNGGQWAGLDHSVDYAIGKGMKVILTLTLRARSDNSALLSQEDCVVDSEGKVDSNWDKTTRMSFSSPHFGRAIRFVQQVGERYKDRQNAGHILAIVPLVTREAEIAYAHDQLEDFSPLFIREFRSWLAHRYDHQIVKLNAAWNTQHSSFDAIQPPQTFDTPAGQDWYRFRDLKTRQFVDSCAAALESISGVTRPFRLILDYGNVGDPMAWKRGSLSFAFHAENPMVLGVKHNDAHDYSQPYTGSLLGSAMHQMHKLAFNEWFYDRDKARYPRGDVIGDSVREIKGHFDQGMNGVSYVGVQTDNKDLEAIVAKLKAEGVWTAPVTPRTTDKATHVKLSELLTLHGWELKERYFDPQFKAGCQQVEVLIDRDFADPLLPVIRPMEYGR